MLKSQVLMLTSPEMAHVLGPVSRTPCRTSLRKPSATQRLGHSQGLLVYISCHVPSIGMIIPNMSVLCFREGSTSIGEPQEMFYPVGFLAREPRRVHLLLRMFPSFVASLSLFVARMNLHLFGSNRRSRVPVPVAKLPSCLSLQVP